MIRTDQPHAAAAKSRARQPRSSTTGFDAGPQAWQLQPDGEWITVPAPWGTGDAFEWVLRTAGRVVFNSDCDPADRESEFDRWNGPWLWVQEYPQAVAESDPRYRLVGRFLAQGDPDGEEIVGEAGTVFLLKGYPALATLVRRWEPLLRWHPGSRARRQGKPQTVRVSQAVRIE